jgi:cytochrome c-type biogenesis protein CcmH/NrfG
VLRQGGVIRVSIRLDPKPVEATTLMAFEELNTRRINDADDYWERDFAPLLESKVI